MILFVLRFIVQAAATRALANLLVDPVAQASFDEECMRITVGALKSGFGFDELKEEDDEIAIGGRLGGGLDDMRPVDGDSMVMGGAGLLRRQADNADFAQTVLILLSSVICDASRARVFADCGGFQVLRMLYDSVGFSNENARVSIVNLLNRMTQDRAIAPVFIANVFEGFDVICRFINKSHESSQFFYQCFAILAYLVIQLNAKDAKDSMIRAYDRLKLGEATARALTQMDNMKLVEAAATCLAAACRTKDEKLLRVVFESNVPFMFIKVGIQLSELSPDPSLLNYLFMSFYNLSDKNMEYAYSFYEKGVCFVYCV